MIEMYFLLRTYIKYLRRHIVPMYVFVAIKCCCRELLQIIFHLEGFASGSLICVAFMPSLQYYYRLANTSSCIFSYLYNSKFA